MLDKLHPNLTQVRSTSNGRSNTFKFGENDAINETRRAIVKQFRMISIAAKRFLLRTEAVIASSLSVEAVEVDPSRYVSRKPRWDEYFSSTSAIH